MPLNSVQLYVQGLLNNLPVPGGTDTIKAWITPPAAEPLSGPRAYVWGGHIREGRQTMPRGPGFRELPWMIEVWLIYETNANVASLDQKFPLVIDAVWKKVWTATMPTTITDPTTNVTSQIIAVGEESELEYPPERTPASLRMVLYTALLRVQVKEVVQL